MKKAQYDEKRITTEQRRYYAGTKFNHYGQLVIAENPVDDTYQVRKITPSERRLLLLKWVYDHSGSIIKDKPLAKALAVNDRTIRRDLANMCDDGYLKREYALDDNGGSLGTRYFYLKGINRDFMEFVPTIKKAHSRANPLGLRDWLWADYKYIRGTYDIYHTPEDQFQNYAELKGKKKHIGKIEKSIRKKKIKYIDGSPEFSMDGDKEMRKGRTVSRPSESFISDEKLAAEILSFVEGKDE